MVEAVGRVHQIDGAACRHAVEERFTVDRLVTDYEALYARLIDTRA